MSMEMIGGWALAKFGKEFLDSAKKLIERKTKDEKEKNDSLQALERRWQDFNWGKSAERYKKHMQEIYGYIRVIGTTEPIPIGDIFTDVYILEKPQAYQRFDMTKLKNLQEEPKQLDNGKRKRGLSIVASKKGHRLYILGKPGAGKTTFMKYLVNQTIIAEELNKLPVFITLRDRDARNNKLIDFIIQQFEICNFPDAGPFIEYLFEKGHAIVLFDGLDEIPQEDNQRDKTIQALHDFSKKHLETQIVITCRVAASDYSFTEFTYIEMADFSKAQVNAYARNWFRNAPNIAKDFLKELQQEENSGVRDLGRSPLLFSMICLAYEETLTIPKRRVELYEEALDALLKKWDSSRKIRRDQNYKNLSLGHKKQMFARIAAGYFDKGIIFFSKRNIAEKIGDYLNTLPPDAENNMPDGEAILEAISAQHGILVERVRGIYSFSHLTFQEYYTAKYITDNANRGTLDQLTKHLSDTRWREVFLLTASLLHEVTPLFESMQTAAQTILINNQKLLSTQAWAIQRANSILAYRESTKRTLYWYFFLNHTLDTTLGIDISDALELIQNRELTLNLALDFGPDHALDMNFDIDNAFDRALVRDATLALDLAHAFTRILSQALDRVNVLALDPAYSIDLDLAFKRAIDLTRALDNALSLASKLAQDTLSQTRKRLDFLKADFDTTILVLLASVFCLFPQKYRLPKKRIEKLDLLLKNWKNNQTNPLHSSKNIFCPSDQASDQEWEVFKREIHNVAKELLEIKLNTVWSSEDYKTARIYLEANQLFSDCLQIARVDDREAVENMILNVPENIKQKTL